jgi:hypothetical protein
MENDIPRKWKAGVAMIMSDNICSNTTITGKPGMVSQGKKITGYRPVQAKAAEDKKGVRSGTLVQVIEHLPNLHKTLGFQFSIPHKGSKEFNITLSSMNRSFRQINIIFQMHIKRI